MRFSRCGEQPHRISGDNSLRDPPVPIPNTEVKPQHADGTWLETARESRSSPDSNEGRSMSVLFVCLFISKALTNMTIRGKADDELEV